MLIKDEYYECIDLKAYYEIVAPLLDDQILDFHAHVWNKPPPSGELAQYPEYNQNPYTVEDLLTAGALMFPKQAYHAVFFGAPDPHGYDCNDYVAEESRRHPHLYPLYIPDMHATEEQVRETVRQSGYYGFKPYWNLVPGKPCQDDVTIMDMLPEPYMRVADDWGLIIMLHIPGSQRLSSAQNIRDIQTLSHQYPNAKIVIAHIGRSYDVRFIKGKIDHICDLPNVYFDTSFVMDSMVYKIFFDYVDPVKVLYGTDLPISELRGKRVWINNSWVDVSRDKLSWTASRDPTRPIEATFMTYEMIRAMREGAAEAGLNDDDLRPIFFKNGMRLIQDVKARLSHLWQK
ncbi:MAG: amidohydrolase family protein [Anaerolineae bacterium]